MHKHPAPNIAGAQPRTVTRKNMLPQKQSEKVQQLSQTYLEVRNRQMSHKAMEAELNLALRRESVVPKDLVKAQAGYLLVNLRQKILNIQNHAHRFVGLNDVSKIRSLLRELAINALKEVADLPNAITNPKWMDKLEKDS